MPTHPLTLVYNPAAGRGTAARRLRPAKAVFARDGFELAVEASDAPGDIEARVRALCDAGHERVLVAGGDGTVHEAVNGILSSSRPAALGVVPLGTGNDFAKACAIPLHAEQAATLLADRIASDVAPRQVDVGRLNGRYFANGAGIGFDARVSSIASSIRLPLGQVVYLVAVLRALVAGVNTPPMTLEFDGNRVEGRFTLANFSNGAWVGGMFPIAPGARNDDGELDLVYVPALTRRQVMKLLPQLLDGRHLEDPGVIHERVTHCRVTAAAPTYAHLDGENLPLQREFEIEILPAALTLI